MAVLDQVLYDRVIEVGKKAIEKLKEDNLDDFYILSEDAWLQFPEPRTNWNQAFNFSKMIYKHCMNNSNFFTAKIWLNRMIENNNNLHLSDDDVWFETAKYQYEVGDYKESYDKFKLVVEDAGFRYFEGEDPKYLNFYKNPEKYIKS